MRLRKHQRVSRPSAMVQEIGRQVLNAIKELETHGANSQEGDEGVHECRRALKRARAGVRLVKNAVDQDVYHQVRVSLRDIGRMLSDARDEKVLLDTGEMLQAAAIGPHEETAARKLMGVLEWAVDQDRLSKRDVRRVTKRLKTVLDAIRDWNVVDDRVEVIEKALDESRTRSRSAMRMAFRTMEDEALHEWRKEVQHLRYQLALLNDAIGLRGRWLHQQAHELSQVLGLDHDLSVMEHRMAQWPLVGLSVSTRVALTAIAERERKKLKKRARTLGIRMA